MSEQASPRLDYYKASLSLPAQTYQILILVFRMRSCAAHELTIESLVFAADFGDKYE